jgi:hypothetical protein
MYSGYLSKVFGDALPEEAEHPGFEENPPVKATEVSSSASGT